MACEHNVWSDIRQACLSVDRDYHSTRIENSVGSGTPDVQACFAGVEHWVETKGMRGWPRVPADRIIRLDHELRLSQRLWHKAHWQAGGNNWVILGLREPEREWLVWSGPVAAAVLDKATREEMIKSAAIYMVGHFPALRFLKLIREREIARR